MMLTAIDHLYNADPQSGAGNCTCGRAETHRLHLHPFRQSLEYPGACICGQFRETGCHR